MICTWNWEAIASFANAIAIVAAAIVANRAFNSWRDEWIARRESEVAEDALALAYEGEQVFRTIRSPLQELIPGEDGKLEEDAGIKDYIKRLNSQQDYFHRLFGALPRIRAVLGETAYKQIRLFAETRIDVMTSLELYAELTRSNRAGQTLSESDRADLKGYRRDIWQTYNKKDRLWAVLIAATETLESELLPKIRRQQRSAFNPHPSSTPR